MARGNAAYYAARDPFADFTTAPEDDVGQVFGELIGAWAAVVWAGLGSPDPVLLVEVGPGRGTLMADALRAVGRVAPAFRAACRVHLVENSARLRSVQAGSVPGAVWHYGLEAVPAGPAIVLANEFLDALPIRQFERRGGAWFERHVLDGGFVLVPKGGAAEGPAVMPSGSGGAVRWDAAAGGDVVEWNEAGERWAAQAAARLVRDGGAALILDYGRAEPGFGDTLQALRGGRRADPLADPGEADLTAHVDFPSLLAVARRAGAAVYGPLAQGVFLQRLGLGVRTERLAAANPDRAPVLQDAADRLAAPSRMGQLFKAACIAAPGMPAPPGFDA